MGLVEPEGRLVLETPSKKFAAGLLKLFGDVPNSSAVEAERLDMASYPDAFLYPCCSRRMWL